MNLNDFWALVHPAIAVAFVFPIVGIVVNFAWQTRQRRQKLAIGEKSTIPPVVGREHVKIGRWLTGSVVGLTLIALAYSIIIKAELFKKSSFQVFFILFMFVATIGALICLYRSQAAWWRITFATLSSAGLIILGCQEGVYRQREWYFSHYYLGITVSILMIISLTILPEIYQDRKNRWRSIHVLLNCFALLLFIGQSMTGVRDLLFIPLSWQYDYLKHCDFKQRECPKLQRLETGELKVVD
jgi:MFS family permease